MNRDSKESAELAEQINTHRDDPLALEKIYRRALTLGAATQFETAIAAGAQHFPNSRALQAWVYRLNLADDDAEKRSARKRRWPLALALSALQGIGFALLADAQPPLPFPGPSVPAFWLGWAPLMTLCVLAFLFVSDRRSAPGRIYAVSLCLLAALTATLALLNAHREDDVAALIALHVPFACWLLVGGTLVWRAGAIRKRLYIFVLKSLSTALTAGIYLASGVVFGALSLGIFAALGIEWPDALIVRLAALGLGAVPLWALASTCDPADPLSLRDEPVSFLPLMHILGTLLTPLSIIVLIVYLVGFVPQHFFQPFYAREVLAVYNGALGALMLLLVLVASRPVAPRWNHLMRTACLLLSGLALALSTYALAAIAYRLYEWGLTPNRLAVMGWNGIALVAITTLLVHQWQHRTSHWIPLLQRSLGGALLWIGPWIVGLCYALSLYFPG